MRHLLLTLLAIVLLVAPAYADAARPVTLSVSEQEPGVYLVQWRVPAELPAGAAPSPILPETCVNIGDRRRTDRAGTWLLEQTVRCPDGLAGEEIGIEYPFVNVTISTIVRVELLSGERYAHVLAPGDTTWRVPETAIDHVPAWMRLAHAAVLRGVAHAVHVPGHLAFVLALALIGAAFSLRLCWTFSLGQVAGVLACALSGLRLAPAHAEIALLAGAAVVASEVLRTEVRRGALTPLAAGCGFLHAGALSTPAAEAALGARMVTDVLAALGFDAVLCLALLVLAPLGRRLARRSAASTGWRSRLVPYAVGAGAVALAVLLPLPTSRDAAASAPSRMRLDDLGIPAAGASAQSRRLAAQSPDASLQSFLTVEAFETRHEALLRLQGLAPLFGLRPDGVIPVERQDELKRQALELVRTRARVTVDGAPVDAVETRVEFLTVDANGALPRPSPVPEQVETAWLGVTSVHANASTPRSATIAWEVFDVVAALPATVTDPELSRTVVLDERNPTLRWENELSEDPAPVVRATSVEPRVVWIPAVALVLLLGAAFLGRRRWRRPQRIASGASARVLVAAALLLGPVAGVTWALPASSQGVPDPAHARRVLAGVLPNLYRSFQFPSEALVYDRLAMSVSGPVLRDVYLEQRRAVEMTERGGARVRVQAVEVLDVAETRPAGDAAPGGFVAKATWTVGGTVTHFGHRHFRQNRYDAEITLAPTDGLWKVHRIEILDEARLR